MTRNPEIVKNTDTPMKPPGNRPGSPDVAPGMEQHDERDGHGPQPVQRCVVCEPRAPVGHLLGRWSVIVRPRFRSVGITGEQGGARHEHDAEERPRMQPLEADRPTGVRVRPARAAPRPPRPTAAATTMPRPTAPSNRVLPVKRTATQTSAGDQPPDPADQQGAGDGGGHDRGHAEGTSPTSRTTARGEGAAPTAARIAGSRRRSKIASAEREEHAAERCQQRSVQRRLHRPGDRHRRR